MLEVNGEPGFHIFLAISPATNLSQSWRCAQRLSQRLQQSLPSCAWWWSVLSFKSSSTQGRAPGSSPFFCWRLLSAGLKIHTIKTQTTATKTGVRESMVGSLSLQVSAGPTLVFKQPGAGVRNAGREGKGREERRGRNKVQNSQTPRDLAKGQRSQSHVWGGFGLVLH